MGQFGENGFGGIYIYIYIFFFGGGVGSNIFLGGSIFFLGGGFREGGE